MVERLVCVRRTYGFVSNLSWSISKYYRRPPKQKISMNMSMSQPRFESGTLSVQVGCATALSSGEVTLKTW